MANAQVSQVDSSPKPRQPRGMAIFERLAVYSALCSVMLKQGSPF
jgi:hypothetical protein